MVIRTKSNKIVYFVIGWTSINMMNLNKRSLADTTSVAGFKYHFIFNFFWNFNSVYQSNPLINIYINSIYKKVTDYTFCYDLVGSLILP